MFYSHEVLTSRKHGVATVWLVATLGSKSTLKRVDRKELCAVNIPKACQTIVSPEAPMALRLQSNLLYGVSRVYGEQCNFVLKDAQAEQNKIRALLRALHTAATELEGKHKAKPNQLILEDDPNFVPELAWGIDFDPLRDDFDITSNEISSQRSSLLSPHAALSSVLGSEHLDPTLDGGIIIPASASSYSAGGGAGFGFGGGSVVSEERPRAFSRSLYGAQDEGLLEDPGFTFDAEGNLIENDTGIAPAVLENDRAASVHTPVPVMRGDALPDINDQGDTRMYDNDDLPPLHNEDVDMSDVAAFTPRNSNAAANNEEADQQHQGAPSQTSSTEASAPQRRTRAPKPLPQDVELELHNTDLHAWDTGYLALMSRVSAQKSASRNLTLAKKNAEFWVLRNGIGGLGTAFGGEDMPEELRMFSGERLIAALTGLELSGVGEKRGRDDGEEEEDGEGRRVRVRLSVEKEVARGGDDVPMFDVGFDGDQTIEQGRRAPTPLADHLLSSAQAFPWNRASSTHSHQPFNPPYPLFNPADPSSSVGGGGGGGGANTGVFNRTSSHRNRSRNPSSQRGRPTSTHRNRTTSASPLIGRGTHVPSPSLDNLGFMSDAAANPTSRAVSRAGSAAAASSHHNDPLDGTAPFHPSLATEYSLFGPAAAVPTQVAQTSQWLSSALSAESLNFLAFVKARVGSRVRGRDDAGEAAETKSIHFDVLLAPASNTRVVASQGFLHVLALVTRGLLTADQHDAFGVIELGVV